SARDTNDCPNYNLVFDTIYVEVLPSPGIPPVVEHNLLSLPADGDTLILDVQENFCYEFYVIDTIGGSSLSAVNTLQDTAGNLLGQVHSWNTWQSGDTLYGEVCWETLCNFGSLYMFVTEGSDEYQCPPGNLNNDTVYLRVLLPYNPAPVTTVDISATPNVVNDTIVARVHENFCFDFSVQDTSATAGDTLAYGYVIKDVNGLIAQGEPATASVFGQPEFIEGSYCWTPRCVNVDQLYMFIVRGTQINRCDITNSDVDTVWVRVIEPYKPPPLISHDLGALSTDNETIELADDEDFCYTFELQDTVTPTFLSYGAQVYYLDGTQFIGAQPSLNFATVTDTFVDGDLCWNVPCELANQSFMILMTGRDTFDCHTRNVVFDTVYINHTENPPAPVNFCNVSVMEGDAAVELSWEVNTESDGVGYMILRKRDDEFAFTVIDSLGSLLDSSYVDANGVEADEHQYCYQVVAVDRCGNVSPGSAEICTMLLTGLDVDYTSILDWTALMGWNQGVSQYEVFRNLPLTGQGEQLLATYNSHFFQHVDKEIAEARNCYRIRATENAGGCGVVSWSNEVCLDFPPTLYVPSAFTPNQDGLNDYFTSF
ncbi:MAG: hypothetical protein AAF570_18415, partial [Bacteroidota bacterium]